MSTLSKNIFLQEVQELKGGTEAHKVSSSFFTVLEKVQRINSDTKVCTGRDPYKW